MARRDIASEMRRLLVCCQAGLNSPRRCVKSATYPDEAIPPEANLPWDIGTNSGYMIIMPYSSSSRRSCVSTWPALAGWAIVIQHAIAWRFTYSTQCANSDLNSHPCSRQQACKKRSGATKPEGGSSGASWHTRAPGGRA